VGETEIGGFGISSVTDLLRVEDVRLVRQYCSPVTVAFDDGAVADFFDAQVDAGVAPERFSRIWLHTHPGDSPLPSSVDEETFARVFGSFHWAVMGIVARNDATYARLQYRVGPHGSFEIPLVVDYSQPFAASDHGGWRTEYDLTVDAAWGRSIDDWDFKNELPKDWPADPEEWEDLSDGGWTGSFPASGRPGAAREASAGTGDGNWGGCDR
jgi:proteasome lid subunit RPN8/RPN11